MAAIINLNRARKAKNRKAKDVAAGENRVRHGRTRAQKQADNTERNRNNKRIDGHHIGGTETSYGDGNRTV